LKNQKLLLCLVFSGKKYPSILEVLWKSSLQTHRKLFEAMAPIKIFLLIFSCGTNTVFSGFA
jgi:hypothetical protein